MSTPPGESSRATSSVADDASASTAASRRAWRIALPVGLAAIALRALAMPGLDDHFVYALAYPATVVAGLLGGWRAALATTVLCGVATPLAIGAGWNASLLFAMLLYLVFGFGMAMLLPRLRRHPRVDTAAGDRAPPVIVERTGVQPPAAQPLVEQRSDKQPEAAPPSVEPPTLDAIRLLHDASPDGFEWLRRVDDGIGSGDFEWLYANPAATAWLGVAPASLAGRRVLAGPHAAMQAARAARWHHALRSASPLRETSAAPTEADPTPTPPADMLVVPVGPDHVAVTTRFVPAAPPGEAAERLLAGLSHELRTPLNAIAGWAHLLSRAGADPRADTKLVQRAVEAIGRNAQAQAALIDRLLDASRIAGGSLRMPRQRCDLGVVLHAAIDETRAAAQARWVSMQPSGLDDTRLQVDGNPERLRQVFVHLLDNAIQHTPLGGRVQVELSLASAHRARVEVRDNGDGISAELMPHVFERFEHAAAGRSRRHGGLGLGLPLVRALVELHGGDVQLISAGPGRGTTACVELPLLEPEAAIELPPEAGDSAVGSLQSLPADDGRYAWRRILVIEDDPDSLDLITELLRRHGAIVRSYDRAESALAAAESGSYDLIISDLGMPGMDGIEFMWRLKHSHHLPKNAIALTAHADYAKHDAARDAGYAHIELKPIRPEHFLHVVDEALAPAAHGELAAAAVAAEAGQHQRRA